jgi:hypothetical protein
LKADGAAAVAGWGCRLIWPAVRCHADEPLASRQAGSCSGDCPLCRQRMSSFFAACIVVGRMFVAQLLAGCSCVGVKPRHGCCHP